MKDRIELLTLLGLSEKQATDFCRGIASVAFDAGIESERDTIHGNIQEGIIGKDGFYFEDWFNEQLK